MNINGNNVGITDRKIENIFYGVKYDKSTK